MQISLVNLSEAKRCHKSLKLLLRVQARNGEKNPGSVDRVLVEADPEAT